MAAGRILALSFVVTTSLAACKEERSENPPRAQSNDDGGNEAKSEAPKDGMECTGKEEHGKPCEHEGISCTIADSSGCGTEGYRCKKGKWAEMYTTCNPPMPIDPPDGKTKADEPPAPGADDVEEPDKPGGLRTPDQLGF